MNDHPDDRPGDEPDWLLRRNRGLRRRIRSVGDTVAVHRDAWQRHNSAVLASGVPLWVVLGDSLSQGIGASAWDCGWVHRSLRQVRLHSGSARDLGVVNLSRSGATTHDVLDPQLVELERLLDGGHRVELVSLVVGANDFLRGGRGPASSNVSPPSSTSCHATQSWHTCLSPSLSHAASTTALIALPQMA